MCVHGGREREGEREREREKEIEREERECMRLSGIQHENLGFWGIAIIEV